MIGITIEKAKPLMNIKLLQKKMVDEVGDSLMDVGHELMRLSQIEVPHDEGTLQNSGVVEQIGKDVLVGYHTPYAARLHEHPEYRFQKGRKGKYLEDPILRNKDKLGITFRDSIQKKIK